MMARDAALQMMEAKIQNINLRRHMLASEAIMQKLAQKFGENPEKWGLVGLLHDIDLEEIEQDMSRHAAVAAQWLESDLPTDALDAIRKHNAEGLGLQRQTKLDHALACAESLTGLVVAACLVLPSKKIEDLKAKSVRKRMKEPRFAAGVNRDIVMECEKIGLELTEFIEIGIEAMQKIDFQLGL